MLKSHRDCTKILYIRQRLVLCARCLENKQWDHRVLRHNYWAKLSHILTYFSAGCIERVCWFQQGRVKARTANTRTAFLRDSYRDHIAGCGQGHQHPHISGHLTPINGEKPRKTAGLQTSVAGTDWQTLRKVVRTALRRVNDLVQEEGKIFNISKN